MSFEEFRRRMNAFWDSANREADEFKDSMLALDRLVARYRSLTPSERQLADRVIAEWLHSPDEAKRFDAVALVREFEISSAIPALRDLSSGLQTSSDPGAPFEREKVEALLAELDANGAAAP